MAAISAAKAQVWERTQADTLSVQVFFGRGSSAIESGFMDNGASIERFLSALDRLSRQPGTQIDSVLIISSSSSPEGNSRLNDRLSDRRARALETLLKEKGLRDVRFIIRSAGEDWERLSLLLKASGIEGSEEAARLIDRTPMYTIRNGRIVGSRKKTLMEYDYGRFWWKMDEEVFPLLRQATVHVFHSPRPGHDGGQELSLAGIALKPRGALAPERMPQPLVPVEPLWPDISQRVKGAGRKPLFAFKTNLLFDAASLVNLGLEVPLGRRFSLAAECYFPWWQNWDKDITIQLLAGDIEGRYWLGDRSRRKPLTGFFVGLYGGAGYFDFQLGKLTDGKGMQGDFFMMGGLSAGYAHSIGRSFRLEYSLGVGYLRCDTREYEVARDTKYGDIKVIQYPWESKRTSGILPTKAAVSLVWLLSTKKGGAR